MRSPTTLFILILISFRSITAQGTSVSADQNWNEAIAHLKTKNYAQGVSQLVHSLFLTDNPVKKIEALETLHAVQRDRGLREDVTQQWSFRAASFFNEKYVIWSFSLAIWSLLLIGLMKFREVWWKKPHQPLARFLAVPIALLFLSVVGGISHTMRPEWAVLIDKSQEAVVYRSPVVDENLKLVTLPGGALVEIGAEEKEFIKIVGPIPGWIRADDIEKIQFPKETAAALDIFRKWLNRSAKG